MSWRAKIASISARSASLIVQPTAPTLSSTSATVRQPTSAVLTAGCEIAQRSASCGEALVVAVGDALQLVHRAHVVLELLRTEERGEDLDRAHVALARPPVGAAEVVVLGERAGEQPVARASRTP